MFEHGIVVGKFSPLHKGHEYLIRTALQQCRKVTLVSYCKPELPGCDAARRRHWIAQLFPQVNALVFDEQAVQQWRQQGWRLAMPDNAAADSVQREFTAELLWQHQCADVDAVFSSETYGEGFARYLQQSFTRRLQRQHRLTHISVDPDRSQIPISASAIRADIHQQRGFLAPLVYADFVKRICFIGGESSGKSTLARCLAQRLQTAWVPEFGRYWWMLRGGQLQHDDYLHIAREQRRLENVAAQQAERYLFCDTSAIVTLGYYVEQFAQEDPALLALALQPYDLIVLCNNDFDFVQDGTRRSAAFSAQQQAWTTDFLQRQNLSYVAIGGGIDARIEQLLRLLPAI